MSFTRTASGLVFKEDWSTGTGWSGSNWGVTSDPTFMASPRSPIPLLLPTPSSPDAGGIRESNWVVDDDGTWWMFNDGGDGTSGSGGPWRVHVSSSTDRGLTWTKHGVTNFVLQKTSNPADGNYGCRSVAYVEKRGSTWYMHAISGNNDAIVPTKQVPADPLQSDLWTASTPLGPWTFVRTVGVIGSPGTYDDTRMYITSVVYDGSLYQGFFGAYKAGNTLTTLARKTATTPGGAWTDVSAGTNWGTSQLDENNKMFYSATLGKYVALSNVPDVGSGTADLSAVVSGDSLTDWTTGTTRHVNQRKSVAGGSYTIGLNSPFYGPEAVIQQTALGYVPVSYDTDPLGPTGVNIVVGRSIWYAVFEPSVMCAQYTFVSGTAIDRYTKTFSHTDLNLEFGCEMPTLTGSNGVGIDYRIQSSGDSYRLFVTCTAARALLLYKSTGGGGGTPGTYSIVGTAFGSQIAVAGMIHKVRLVVMGNRHQAWLDGEQQIDFTDSSSPYTSGVSIAFIATRASAQVRNLSIRTSDDITINGTVPGQTITLRAPGGVPLITETTTGSSHTFSYTHYPAGSIQLDNEEFVPDTMIWGGDAFSVKPSFGPVVFNRWA